MTAYELFLPIIGLVIVGLGIYMIATSEKEQEKQEKKTSDTSSAKPNSKVRGIILVGIGLMIFVLGLVQALM